MFPVAKHILSLVIDERLRAGDISLVSEIQRVTINNVEKNFYSFATKYCSHHCPLDFPIYDSYVEKVLCYFRNRDKFASFKNQDLKDYAKFKGILIEFRSFYGLNKYNLKEIEIRILHRRTLWQKSRISFCWIGFAEIIRYHLPGTWSVCHRKEKTK